MVDAVDEQAHIPYDQLADSLFRLLLLPFFCQQRFDVLLCFGHVHLLPDHHLQHVQPFFFRRQAQQRPCVALGQAVFQRLQHCRAVAQQAQLVGDRALAFAHFGRRLLLIQPILPHQPRQPLRLLDVVQIPALQILHQRHHAGLLLIHAQQNAGNFRQSCKLCRAQAALPCHQLIHSASAPHRERLQNTIRPNARRQLLQSAGIKDLPRLRRIWLELLHRQIEDPAAFQQSPAPSHLYSSFVSLAAPLPHGTVVSPSFILAAFGAKTRETKRRNHNKLRRVFVFSTTSWEIRGK